jgi:hypothetical protein
LIFSSTFVSTSSLAEKSFFLEETVEWRKEFASYTRKYSDKVVVVVVVVVGVKK